MELCDDCYDVYEHHRHFYNQVLKELLFRKLDNNILYEIHLGNMENLYFFCNFQCMECGEIYLKWEPDCDLEVEFWTINPINEYSYQIITMSLQDILHESVYIIPYHDYYNCKNVNELYDTWKYETNEYMNKLTQGDKFSTIRVIKRENNEDCDICLKTQEEMVRCKVCKKEICLDCRLNINKCPFCRSKY